MHLLKLGTPALGLPLPHFSASMLLRAQPAAQGSWTAACWCLKMAQTLLGRRSRRRAPLQGACLQCCSLLLLLLLHPWGRQLRVDTQLLLLAPLAGPDYRLSEAKGS